MIIQPSSTSNINDPAHVDLESVTALYLKPNSRRYNTSQFANTHDAIS